MNRDEKKIGRQGDAPSDTESLVGDTAASDELTDRKRVQPSEVESREHADGRGTSTTTTGKITSPAFGSGISGGALADPGPPKD